MQAVFPTVLWLVLVDGRSPVVLAAALVQLAVALVHLAAALVHLVVVLVRQLVNSRFRMGRFGPQALVVLVVVQVAALVDHLVLVAQY